MNYLIKADYETDFSSLIKENVSFMRNDGDVIRHKLHYDETVDFPSLKALDSLLHKSARKSFCNDFTGVAIVDISEWIYHENSQKLRCFLEYVSDSKADFCLIIKHKKSKSTEAKALESTVMRAVNIKAVKAVNSKEDMIKEMYHYLLANCVVLKDKEASVALQTLVKDISKLPGFCRNTIRILANDMARYARDEKFSEYYSDGIRAYMLQSKLFYSDKSHNSSRTIGFINNEKEISDNEEL